MKIISLLGWTILGNFRVHNCLFVRLLGKFGEVRKAIAKGLLNDNEEVIVAVKQAKKGGKFKCNRVLNNHSRMT